jgi:hypothetical protein
VISRLRRVLGRGQMARSGAPEKSARAISPDGFCHQDDPARRSRFLANRTACRIHDVVGPGEDHVDHALLWDEGAVARISAIESDAASYLRCGR